jgi:apolipoprotein N-acyltransferase
VGVIQQNIPRYVEDYTSQTHEQFCRENIQEIEKAATLSLELPKPLQLVVWPETTVQAPLNVDPSVLRAGPLTRVIKRARKAISSTAAAYDCPLLVGARGWFPRDRGYVRRAEKGSVEVIANSAILFSADGEYLERYDKMELVPFGEYIPLGRWLSWLTPFRTGLTPGKTPVLFDTDDTRFGVLICYEDVFPGIVRTFVRRGADYLVNITEEGWYHIPGEMEQHVAMAVFRAVENRTTLIRAGNTGISCFIGPSGEIYAQVAKKSGGTLKRKWVEGSAAAPVRLSDQQTLYTQTGDLFAWAALVFSAALAAFGWWRRRKQFQSEASE